MVRAMSDERAIYVFTFSARRRSRPSKRYGGILSTHRFYVEYYNLLSGEDPAKAIQSVKPKITFPVRFVEAVLSFAKEVGGEIVDIRKVNPPRTNSYYEKPIVVLPNEIAFRRHLLFTLTGSTYLKPSRLSTLKNLVLGLNANFLNMLTTIALDRYSELRGSSNPTWYWHLMRVGRAFKVLYKID